MPSSDNSSLMVHILSFQKTNKLELVLTAEMLSTSGRTAEETSLPRNLFNTVHFPLIRGGFVQFSLNVFSLRPMCYVCALVSRPSTDLLVNFQSTLSKKKILYTTSFLLFLSFFFFFFSPGLLSCTKRSLADQGRVSWFQEHDYQEEK